MKYVLVAAELTRLTDQDEVDGQSHAGNSLKKSVRAENAQMKEKMGDIRVQLEDLATLAHDFNLTPRSEVSSDNCRS